MSDRIDKQHGTSMAKSLEELELYTTPIELEAGELLNDENNHGDCRQRGLYFIEHGLLKCEHDSSASLTRGRARTLFATAQLKGNTNSIGKLRARTATVGRGSALLKGTPGLLMSQFTTREFPISKSILFTVALFESTNALFARFLSICTSHSL